MLLNSSTISGLTDITYLSQYAEPELLPVDLILIISSPYCVLICSNNPFYIQTFLFLVHFHRLNNVHDRQSNKFQIFLFS
jgi:hypothetical protein